MLTETLATAAAFALAALLTPWVLRVATAKQIVDRPNARSSHTRPVARGGGIAIVIAFTAVVATLWLRKAVGLPLVLTLIVGGLAVAIVGFMDDRGSLSVRARIIVHFAAAIWAVYQLGGPTAFPLGGWSLDPGVPGKVLSVVGIVWTLNLFNFMDGIDGIAASESAFVAFAGAAIGLVIGGSAAATALVSSALGGASVGFLLFNWPPARIFMGDVGSGYLGYCIAALALAAAHERAAAIPVWLILAGVFFVDATVTLLRRLARGERIHHAHRTHAYQWLSRRWQSHQRVTAAIAMVNLFWLLPWAMLASRYPNWALAAVLGALGPLVGVAIATGSGRREPIPG